MISSGSRTWAETKSFYEKTFLQLSEQTKVITGPLQIGYDITNRCVMRCQHCFNRSSTLKRDEMSDEQVRQTISQIIELKPQQVCICGGEPLVREKLVVECGSRLRDSGISLGMVTNGFLLNKTVAQKIKKADFQQVQVSLDGFRRNHDKLRGVDGAFDRAVAAIKILCDVGIKPVTSFSPTQYNILDFPEYVEFAKSIGVKEVRVQPLMPIGEAQFSAEIFPTDDQYYELCRFIKKYNYLHSKIPNNQIIDINDVPLTESKDFSLFWGDPVDHIIRFSTLSTKLSYSFHIYSTGKIAVSPYLPITFGDINRHSLREYWNAGLNSFWELRLVQAIAKQIRSIHHMGNVLPLIYLSDDIEIDIIENSEKEMDELADFLFGPNIAI